MKKLCSLVLICSSVALGDSLSASPGVSRNVQLCLDITRNLNCFKSDGVNLTSTTTGSFLFTGPIDAASRSTLNIGAVNATTINIGRSSQSQVLLGTAIFAGSAIAQVTMQVNGPSALGASSSAWLYIQGSNTDPSIGVQSLNTNTGIAIVGKGTGSLTWNSTAAAIDSVGNTSLGGALTMSNPINLTASTSSYLLDLRSSANGTGVHVRSNSTSDTGGYLVSEGNDELFTAGGAAYNGTNWVAKSTCAGIWGHSFNAWRFYQDCSLTPGGTYTPTLRGTWDFNGFTVSNAFTANGGISASSLGLGTALSVPNGGTGSTNIASPAGGVIYANGTRLSNSGAGTTGQCLVSQGGSAPIFGDCASLTPTTLSTIYLNAVAPAAITVEGGHSLASNFTVTNFSGYLGVAGITCSGNITFTVTDNAANSCIGTIAANSSVGVFSTGTPTGTCAFTTGFPRLTYKVTGGTCATQPLFINIDVEGNY